jgi:hypothetical protein
MQRINQLLLLLCISGLVFSCTSAEYIKTGNEFSPLAETEEIKVFTSSKPEQKYERIGLIRIRGGSPEKRIAQSTAYARAKGGNAVIARETGTLTEPGTDTIIEQIGASTYETQEFVIIKLSGEMLPAKVEQTPEESKDDTGNIALTEPDAASFDYSKIPRATYSQLINDYKSLQGKMFKGSLYPKKMFKIPAALSANTETGDRLILLSTKTGKSNIYMIISNDKISVFQSKIKSGELLDFVYSPVQVYKSKAGTQPVIKFIEEIVEVKN